MQINIPDVEIDIRDGKTRAVIKLGLPEVQKAVSMFLRDAGFQVPPDQVAFTHSGDYDTREFSGATASIVVEIKQAT